MGYLLIQRDCLNAYFDENNLIDAALLNISTAYTFIFMHAMI